MLLVTDMDKLPAYGFKPEYTYKDGRTLWRRLVKESEDGGVTVSITVNAACDREREAVLYVDVAIGDEEYRKNVSAGYGYYGNEIDLPLDVIFDMIADGVLEKVVAKEAAA